MSTRGRLSIRLLGPLLVGGYSSPIGALDATTAVDSDGLPIIPASALKGALREACTRLAHGQPRPHHACTLVDPCDARADAGLRCVVCRLFGQPGADTGDVLLGADGLAAGSEGRVLISDARAKTPRDGALLHASLTVRHGVGLDRFTRSAAARVLFQREVLDAPGAVLASDVVALDVDEPAWNLFLAALPLVTGIGNSRSRGLGHVELRWDASPEPATGEAAHALPGEAPPDGLALLRITAVEPLVLGGLPPTSGFVDTLAYVPGSALRGALGNAAARLGIDDAAIRRVFVEEPTRLLFSDAWPASRDERLPVPIPLTSLACKHRDRRNHPPGARPTDGLFALALLPGLLARGGRFTARVCPICSEPLRSSRGTFPHVEIQKRVVTRLARDIATGSAMPAMLYASARIQRGTQFAGTLSRLTGEALALLRTLAGTELRLGRGRSRGQGRVELELTAAPHLVGVGAVERRQRAFDLAVTPLLPLLGTAARHGTPPGGATAVLARTDLAFDDPASAAERIQRALFKPNARVECIATAQAVESRSGWDEGKTSGPAGPRGLRPVVAAGSAWLFLHEGDALQAPEHVARVEAEGVGAACELGLGRLVVDHELFRE